MGGGASYFSPTDLAWIPLYYKNAFDGALIPLLIESTSLPNVLQVACLPFLANAYLFILFLLSLLRDNSPARKA